MSIVFPPTSAAMPALSLPDYSNQSPPIVPVPPTSSVTPLSLVDTSPPSCPSGVCVHGLCGCGWVGIYSTCTNFVFSDILCVFVVCVWTVWVWVWAGIYSTCTNFVFSDILCVFVVCVWTVWVWVWVGIYSTCTNLSSLTLCGVCVCGWVYTVHVLHVHVTLSSLTFVCTCICGVCVCVCTCICGVCVMLQLFDDCPPLEEGCCGARRGRRRSGREFVATETAGSPQCWYCYSQGGAKEWSHTHSIR